MSCKPKFVLCFAMFIVILRVSKAIPKLSAPDGNHIDEFSSLQDASINADLEEELKRNPEKVRTRSGRIQRADDDDDYDDDDDDNVKEKDKDKSPEEDDHVVIPDPMVLSRDEESFNFSSTKEYIFVSKELRWTDANNYCQRMLHGTLALIEDDSEAKFVAKALAETNLLLDNSFIGAKRHKNDLFSWYWFVSGSNSSTVDEILMEDFLIVRKNDSKAKTRLCLAFARKNVNDPLFVDLQCDVERTFICQRRPLNNRTDNEYFRKWLPIGDALYSVFSEKLNRDSARKRCRQFDEEASLAVVPTTTVANILGQYLLIQRPSLENAWTDGIFDVVSGWIFESTDKRIPVLQLVEKDGLLYPPWNKKHPQRPDGCILLNIQYGVNNTVFMPTRCNRLSPYICYKPRTDIITSNRVDFRNINGINYRLYLKRVPWETAKEICEKDRGKLAEPQNGEADLRDYIFMMGETQMEIRHMWLGGRYIKRKWMYPSTDNEIDNIKATFWFKNLTYIDHVERENICLNIDREYHLIPILYGASCLYPQYFLCQIDMS